MNNSFRMIMAFFFFFTELILEILLVRKLKFIISYEMVNEEEDKYSEL